jgi:hypothetical protein
MLVGSYKEQSLYTNVKLKPLEIDKFFPSKLKPNKAKIQIHVTIMSRVKKQTIIYDSIGHV